MADYSVFGSSDGSGGFEVGYSEYSYYLAADNSAFTFNAPVTPTSFVYTRNIPADSGTLTLSGADVSLVYADYRVVADSGAYALDGTASAFVFTRVLAADSGSFSLTGIDATIEQVYLMPAAVRSYTITAPPVSLKTSRKLQIDSVDYTLTLASASVIKQVPITVDSGAYTLTGTAARFDYSAYSEWVVQSKSSATWAAA